MPTAALIIGTGLSAGSQIMGGFQAQRESEAEAQQQQMQGQVEATRANAGIVENDYQARKALGQLNASAASSGVMPTSGSVKAVRSMDESMAILRDTYARYQGTAAEQNAYYRAKATRYAGNQAMYAGLIGAGSTALTSAFNYSAMKDSA